MLPFDFYEFQILRFRFMNFYTKKGGFPSFWTINTFTKFYETMVHSLLHCLTVPLYLPTCFFIIMRLTS